MKIVIDIPEDRYNQLISERDLPFRLDIEGYITDGTPLPKGHGRLIDAGDLLTVTDIREDGSEFTYVPYDEIEGAITIIDEDRENK